MFNDSPEGQTGSCALCNEAGKEIATLKDKMSRLIKHIGNPGQCRKCPAAVYWVTSNKGKPSPLNADGTSHFANCPGAREVRVEQNQKRINEQRERDQRK